MKRQKVTNYVPLLVIGIVGLAAGGILMLAGSENGSSFLAFGIVITVFSLFMVIKNR